MKIITILRRREILRGERAAKCVEAHAPTSPAGGVNTKLQSNFHFFPHKIEFITDENKRLQMR
jgi:hypothetical protein